jgi:hypothetical protein
MMIMRRRMTTTMIMNITMTTTMMMMTTIMMMNNNEDDNVNDNVLLVAAAGGPVPVFRQRLQDLTYETGDTITMYCALEGSPPFSTVWYRNEELLSDGSRSVFRQLFPSERISMCS